MVVLAVLLAGCGSGSQAMSTSSPSTASTTSTTMRVPPTTVSTPELRAVEELTTLTRLQPGITYRHSGLETPFTISPELDGWAVGEIGRRFIQLESNHPDAGPGVVATVMLFRPSDSIEEVAALLTSSEIASDTSPSEAMTIGTLEGITFDLLVLPDPDNTLLPRNLGGDPECALLAELFAERIDRVGGAFSVDLVGCAWNRVWLIDVDGITVLLTVGPDVRTKDEINELTELGPYVDDFIDAITFCTEEPQCDG